MNKKTKTLLLLGIIVVVLILAVVGYNLLAGQAGSDQGTESQTTTGEETGTFAPDFEMTDSEGNTVKYTKSNGKPTVINFWATWCPPCKAELQDFDDAYKKYGDEVDFLMVNVLGRGDTKEDVNRFVKQNNYQFPYYFDDTGAIQMNYGIMYLPTTVFINESGEVTWAKEGQISGSALVQQVEKLLKK